MKFLACLLVFVGNALASNIVVPATTLYRTPEHDSAVIQSERYGGNFAYSTLEGHAYKAVSPIVQNVVRPVAVSYQTKFAPLAYAAAPAPIAYAAGPANIAYAAAPAPAHIAYAAAPASGHIAYAAAPAPYAYTAHGIVV